MSSPSEEADWSGFRFRDGTECLAKKADLISGDNIYVSVDGDDKNTGTEL
jgi:hypothetical protein